MRQLFMGVLLGAGGPRSRFGTSDDGSADNNRRQNVLQPTFDGADRRRKRNRPGRSRVVDGGRPLPPCAGRWYSRTCGDDKGTANRGSARDISGVVHGA
jgi:hypothetical protein